MFLPGAVQGIIGLLNKEGYEAYVVGGCVRDHLLGKEPKDYDITTDAKPDEVINIFYSICKIIPTGLKHGTVTLLMNSEPYEVTTYRIDGEYSDNRRPDSVEFTNNLIDDLSRRDFTMNAIAYHPEKGFVDPFNGEKDIEKKIIRCVGNCDDRFKEDALRIMRAIRFCCQNEIDFSNNLFYALENNSNLLKSISIERIRDELIKIIMSKKVSFGIYILLHMKILNMFIPELEKCDIYAQKNPAHDKDVLGHTMSVVEKTEPNFILRLAALFHDVGKPACFSIGSDGYGHFYEHHKISADMARDILTRLKFDNKTIDNVCKIIYEHMARFEPKNKRAAKRLINRVGIENLDNLFKLMIADTQDHNNHDIRLDKVLKLRDECNKIINEKQPITIKDLAINGDDLLELGVKQGKEMGGVLRCLLEVILDVPEMNEKETLIDIVKDQILS